MRAAFLIPLVLTGVVSCAPAGEEKMERVRASALAGSWYPGDKAALKAAVEGYLAAEGAAVEGRVGALVVPHAGYVYSGRVAGSGWRLPKREAYDRVILMGPSHHGRFRGFCVADFDAFATPLGLVPLDKPACDALRTDRAHVSAERAHIPEHCLEIQLPFIQTVLPGVKIVPILIGSIDGESAAGIAAAVSAQVTPRTLVVVSTDFTHYGPNYDYVPFRENVAAKLRALDMGAVDAILAKDAGRFDAYCAGKQATICGRSPLSVLLRMLPAGAKGTLVKYDTSGHVTGDYANSVSYVSMAFTWPATAKGEPAKAEAAPAPAVKPAAKGLTDDEKKFLLRLARRSIESRLAGGKDGEPDLGAFGADAMLRRKCGAFVTLKKHGELRGCIGRIAQPGTEDSVPPLYQTIRLMSVESATGDPRFPPVTAAEMKEIEIEISALTPAEPISGPAEFQVGRDGIIIRKGYSGAVFLPQVAPEQGWDRDQTLSHLCRKAGLPVDEWKKPGMKFFTFTAQVFDEGMLKK